MFLRPRASIILKGETHKGTYSVSTFVGNCSENSRQLSK